jgi:dTDP-3-amino-3,4,6-trideoxy-alpha-D-glucose transaminase
MSREVHQRKGGEAPPTVRFADVRSPSPAQDREILAEIEAIVGGGRFILGQDVERFEAQFAAYCGSAHAVGLGNGTDALALGLKAKGIGPGDEVLLPVNSFVATAEAVVHAGGSPVLVDIDTQTFTMDPAEIERNVTSATKAVMPVHLYGNPADMDEIAAIAARHGLVVFEDAAQAHGARYKGRRVGSLGAFAAFSFYPSKNLSAWGDAGAIVTNDAELAATLRKLRNHGGAAKFEHDLVGYNSRLDSIQAAVLAVKLRHLDEWNERRRELAANYHELLAGIPDVSLPTPRPYAEHVYHLYVIRVPAPRRDELRAHLSERGIETGIHYPRPIHLTPAFAFLGFERGRFPAAEKTTDRIISLPMHLSLTEADQEQVARAIREFARW